MEAADKHGSCRDSMKAKLGILCLSPAHAKSPFPGLTDSLSSIQITIAAGKIGSRQKGFDDSICALLRKENMPFETKAAPPTKFKNEKGGK